MLHATRIFPYIVLSAAWHAESRVFFSSAIYGSKLYPSFCLSNSVAEKAFCAQIHSSTFPLGTGSTLGKSLILLSGQTEPLRVYGGNTLPYSIRI